jgi:hypothetical protein
VVSNITCELESAFCSRPSGNILLTSPPPLPNSMTVTFNILQMTMILTPSVPPILRAMFSIPNIAITNAMACRVYRNIRFGRMQDKPTIPSSGSTSKSGSMPLFTRPRGKHANDSYSGHRKLDLPTGTDTLMQITKTVETETVVDSPSGLRYPPQSYQKSPALTSEWIP